jgi:predicted nucleotidyltransferase
MTMQRDQVIAALRGLEPALRAQGIARLWLFGSAARDDASGASDVDIAFDVNPGVRFDLFDQARISVDLTEALGVHVDFVEQDSMQPIIAHYAAADMIQVF